MSAKKEAAAAAAVATPATPPTTAPTTEPSPKPAAPVGLRAWLEVLKAALLPALAVFVVLALMSGGRFWRQSAAPHFVYQAMAFLQGQLHLAVPPPNNEDWVFLGGKWFSSFPAFPALLMTPFVAVFGYQFNDTSFSVVVGALNFLAFFLALRGFALRGDSERSANEDLLLAAVLCFGTVHFYCALRGEVWFTAEVMGVSLTCLYVFFATGLRNPGLAGLFFSMATLTRTPVMFSGVWFLSELFLPNGRLADLSDRPLRTERLKQLGQFVAGALPLALWHAWMNQARFGSPGDFGHTHFFNNRVNSDIAQWGLFHPHYLERNLRAAFLLLPKIQWSPFRADYDPHGLSLFLTSPVFVLAAFPKKVAAVAGEVARVARPTLGLTLALAAMSLPGLLYMNDGYIQFGFRFSLDWTPYVLFLVAVGRRRFDTLFWGLVGVGLVTSTWGAFAFRGFTEFMRPQG